MILQQTKRYASTREEEAEADRSIHIEAIERSRASQADLGRSLIAQDSSDNSDPSRDSIGLTRDDYEPDDFGGGADFGDDDDDGGFVGFHDGDHRFSSESFQAVSTLVSGRLSGGTATQQPSLFPQPAYSQATILLDAIASGDISTSQSGNPYEYFNSQALANLSSGNMWAGADHWKKMTKTRKVGTNKSNQSESALTSMANTKKKGRKPKSSSTVDRKALVDIANPVDNLKELLKKPSAAKRSKALTKLQWTKAMQTKYSNVDNLLPTDAGLGVKELTTLFLRPNANLAEMASEGHAKTKSHPKAVGFGSVETWGGDIGGYSDNEDDGGFGFDFGGDNGDGDTHDFVVPDLEGVRKVEKIKVGYATVAKKVDVKRLKHDLWEELERTFKERGEMLDESVHAADPLEQEITAAPTDRSIQKEESDKGPISFQETIRDMQSSQSQADVTLPFYFICVLHLCNEKGLTLEPCGLNDFIIHSS
jgi:condensin complex subunit 2